MKKIVVPVILVAILLVVFTAGWRERFSKAVDKAADATGIKELSTVADNIRGQPKDGASALPDSPDGTARAGEGPVVAILAADVLADSKAMRDGCWARLYSGRNFSGSAIVVVGGLGRVSLAGMPMNPMNQNAGFLSIETGPSAMVKVFGPANGPLTPVQVAPGTKIPDLYGEGAEAGGAAVLEIGCTPR